MRVCRKQHCAELFFQLTESEWDTFLEPLKTLLAQMYDSTISPSHFAYLRASDGSTYDAIGTDVKLFMEVIPSAFKLKQARE